MSAGHQSVDRIVYSALDVTSWMQAPPSVEAARPGRCPVCGGASRPAGGRLGLHGHGFRERQQRGPPSPDAEPQIICLRCRRYLCQEERCGAVILVVPRGVLHRRLYSAPAIALAFALFGCARIPPAEVRSRVSPWRIVGDAAAGGWTTLRRWVRAVRGRALFRAVRAVPASFTTRQLAERAATTLAAHAPPGCDRAPIATRAFFGARYVS